MHVYLSVYLHCTCRKSGSAPVSRVIFAMCDFTDSLSHIRHMTSRKCCLFLSDSNNVSSVMKFSWRVKSDGKAWGNFSSKSFSLSPTACKWKRSCWQYLNTTTVLTSSLGRLYSLRLMKRHPVWPVAVEKTAPMRFWAGEQSTARPWDMRMGAATVVAAAIKSETSSVSELPHSLPCSITQNPLLGSP